MEHLLTKSCQRCSSMRADKCSFGLAIKAEVKIDGHDNHISLKFGDEVLNTLLKQDVKRMDENGIAELLLFLEDVRVKYNSSTFIVTEGGGFVVSCGQFLKKEKTLTSASCCYV